MARGRPAGRPRPVRTIGGNRKLVSCSQITTISPYRWAKYSIEIGQNGLTWFQFPSMNRMRTQSRLSSTPRHASDLRRICCLRGLTKTQIDKDATDYFRGIVKMNEMSERVLKLTESIIRMNPAHYSAWCVIAPSSESVGILPQNIGNIATKLS